MMKHSSCKCGRSVHMGVIYMHIEVFKEELAWAADKQLLVVSNVMLYTTVIPLRNYRIKHQV